jgi:hypothetical protein
MLRNLPCEDRAMMPFYFSFYPNSCKQVYGWSPSGMGPLPVSFCLVYGFPDPHETKWVF